MLTNFFKNIFLSNKKDSIPNADPVSVCYDRLNALNDYAKLNNLQCFSDDLLEKSLNKAIENNNLPLIKNLYPYMRKYTERMKNDKHSSHLFTLATTAMKENKIDIFDYFIKTYIDIEFAQNYSPRFSDWEFGNLIELMIADEKIPYFKILLHYQMFCCQGYLADYLSGDSYHIRNNSKQLTFMLKNFPVRPHEEGWSRFFDPSTIDVNELLISAGKAEKLERDVIEILLDNGADINHKGGYALSLILNKMDMDVFRVLEKKNVSIDIKKIKVDNPIYPFVLKWLETKRLSDVLEKELDVKEASFVKTKVNKL